MSGFFQETLQQSTSTVAETPQADFYQQNVFQQSFGASTGTGAIHEIPQGKEEGTQLAAVIVTIRAGGSYDDLFAKVKQKAATVTHVNVYLASNCSTTELMAALDETGGGETGAKLRADIAAVDPASVVFNWECCSGCSEHYMDGNGTIALMAALLAKGFMVMVSDFSLGALINDWNSAVLGANPFLLVGQFSTEMMLRFDPTVLATCDDSAQLQMLGELCASGEARVHAMGGTKAFTVNSAVTAADHPEGVQGWSELQVLTIVTTAGGRDASTFTEGKKKKQNLCTVGDHHGIAGHVVLRFPSGGRLLASCPHWIELSKLDVNAEQLLAVAERRYGAEYANQMRTELASFGNDTAAKAAYSSAQSCAFVQQSAPAKYSKKKGW